MLKILFVSANNGGGGSEELWVQTAGRISSLGHNVTALTEWNGVLEREKQLARAGVNHVSLSRGESSWIRALRRSLGFSPWPIRKLRKELITGKPDLVVFNSGTLLDGIPLLEVLVEMGTPFTAVTHLVSTDNWPSDSIAERIYATFARALVTNFVSEHNRHLFSLQVGSSLENSKIIRNPFLVSAEPSPMPPISSGLPISLALPARLHPRTKGQDILFEVLSRPQWKNGSVRVTICGRGGCERSLKRLSKKLDLENIVTFAGHVEDMDDLWRSHHALILPSRHEGLPIAQVEAMLAGRIVIATPAGGIAEMMIPGKTGFLANACNADALEVAMIDAWSNRCSWSSMGVEARQFVKSQIPSDPVKLWADELIEMAEGLKRNRSC